MKNKLYIITGGPGVGKTTLLAALEEDGYLVIPEAARAIIKQQIETNGDALPWKNKDHYLKQMLEASIRDYQRVIEEGKPSIYFFDRGVYDAVCYAEMTGCVIAEPEMNEVMACRYNKKVFILPPWPEIYETDSERKQTWEEAEYTYHQLKMTYRQYGYEVIDVPKDTAIKRKEFILSHIKEVMSGYLKHVKKQFLYYKVLGEQAMEQLQEGQLFWQYNEESNSIATLVNHIAGNMLSRFTDFLTSDGEKPWRNRDSEFINSFRNKEELMKHWNKGWDCLLNALGQLTDADLDKTVYIRTDGHTVTEAINRQLAHYPYHIGQMVFIAKMLKNEDWKTLSIAKNKSSRR